MPTRKPAAKPRAIDPRANPAVDAFLRGLDHPMKPEIEAVRTIVLGADPAIREEIKWNAPSFRTTEHFATFNLRAKDRVRLILHLGSKIKATAKSGIQVTDPDGLLEWLAKDRCLVSLGDAADIRAKRAALEAIISEWIEHV